MRRDINTVGKTEHTVNTENEGEGVCEQSDGQLWSNNLSGVILQKTSAVMGLSIYI